MIELTPLDVRKKRGDFRRAMRGFDPGEVDAFLELVAERMESLVKENLTLKERTARLQDQVREQGGRESAVQEALVTAQELRKDISGQAQREAELIKREAEAEIERMLLDAEHRAEELRNSAVELERRRRRFLRAYHQYLERELDEVDRESARHPLEEPPLALDLDGLVAGASAAGVLRTSSPATSRETPTETTPDNGTPAAPVHGIPDSSLDVVGDSLPDRKDPSGLETTSDEEGGRESGPAVRVESLAPESVGRESVGRESVGRESSELESSSAESSEGTPGTTDTAWPGTARMPTEVSSDRAGDPDGL